MPSARTLDGLERAIVDHLFDLAPGAAVFLGRHEYDGRLPDLSTAGTDRWLAGAEGLRAELDALPPPAASGRAIDRRLLELLLESPAFNLRDARELERNPMSYLGAASMTSYLVRDYAPAADRVRAMIATLRGVPALLGTGRARLDDVLPMPFVALAETIGRGLPSHFDEVEAFTVARAPEMRGELDEARAAAQDALASFLLRLERHWRPKATPEFALGPERFQRLLWVREGIRTPFEEIREAGQRDLERNQARLAELARSSPGGPSVDALLESLYVDHPSSGELIAETRGFVDEARALVLEKRLATIPEPSSCRVEETPSYGRALSTASMNPPGPFERHGDEGIYFVTPVDPAWSPARQEEWLRSLNRPMLRNITVHEVYPGHYLQFLHHRRAPTSLVRKVGMSDCFTEGWAHYCEQLAVEAGFRGGAPSAEAAQLHDALLRDCRLLAAIGLHTGGMTLEQATGLFVREAHMERLPAEREAIRGTFNPEYFCYTLGKLAILEARRRHLAPDFGGDLGRFHDRLLSFGAPPVGMIEELLGGASA